MEAAPTPTLLQLEAVRQLVRKHAGIALKRDKDYFVAMRLSEVCAREGFTSISALVHELLKPPSNGLCRKVAESMTINETSFFRDAHPYATLREQVLPSLLAARAGLRVLNIACHACSTGQEPYSIAMLLREHFPQLATWKVRIIATDFSTVALDRARRGVFSRLEVNRGLPASLLVKHFKQVGLEWHISEALRQTVTFMPINLVADWPTMPVMDIVFLRNVLIYFEVPTKAAILRKIRDGMRKDGTLFLGSQETSMSFDPALAPAPFAKAGVFQLRAGEVH